MLGIEYLSRVRDIIGRSFKDGEIYIVTQHYFAGDPVAYTASLLMR